MDMSRMTALALSTLILSVAAVGCDDDDGGGAITQSLTELRLDPGVYRSDRCYINRVETQLATTDRWSIAEFTFNEDGTGAANYSVYSDSNCTNLLGEVDAEFSDVSVTRIGSVDVIRAEQDATVVAPIWWIPVRQVTQGYSFDVDFTDRESGPYLIEPSVADLESFRVNGDQGVTFQRIGSAPTR